MLIKTTVIDPQTRTFSQAEVDLSSLFSLKSLLIVENDIWYILLYNPKIKGPNVVRIWDDSEDFLSSNLVYVFQQRDDWSWEMENDDANINVIPVEISEQKMGQHIAWGVRLPDKYFFEIQSRSSRVASTRKRP